MITKKPGIHRVDSSDDIKDELFLLDIKIAKATPHVFQIETPEKFLDWLTDKKARSYIYNDEDGNHIGYFSIINTDQDRLELLTLGIDPDYQRRGYGKKIIEYFEETARKKNKKVLWLVTNPDNQPAIRLYEKRGFMIKERIENYYGDGAARYIMEKSLRNV